MIENVEWQEIPQQWWQADASQGNESTKQPEATTEPQSQAATSPDVVNLLSVISKESNDALKLQAQTMNEGFASLGTTLGDLIASIKQVSDNQAAGYQELLKAKDSTVQTATSALTKKDAELQELQATFETKLKTVADTYSVKTTEQETKYQQLLADHQKLSEAFQKEHQQAENALKSSELTKLISSPEANIIPQLRNAAYSLFVSKLNIRHSDNGKVVFAEDVPLVTAFNQWLESNEGKAFRQPATTSGAVATGNNNHPVSSTDIDKYFDNGVLNITKASKDAATSQAARDALARMNISVN
jgi:predicted phage tail protein